MDKYNHIQGVPEKNGRKFAALHFCNRMLQSHAVFNNMSRNKLLTREVKDAILIDYTHVMALMMTCTYFRSINKEYISTRQIFY